MTLLPVVIALWLAAGPTRPASPELRAAFPSLTPRSAPTTPCAACHSTASWTQSRFAHDKTGFALKGAHQLVGCKQCHADSFTAPLPRECIGCHRDAHAGETGAFCQGCHDETSWISRFDAEAHRRTNFPLRGRHALIPCTECHFDLRDRRFGRPFVDCSGCHLDDYRRTLGTRMDHELLGMSLECRQCHSGSKFRPAKFPQHDACFPLASHAGMECQHCHAVGPPRAFTGVCSNGRASCNGCHEHACPRSDAEHANVPGYQCQDTLCVACHRDGNR